MTGRDLIIYILENNLENEPVLKNGTFLGFMNSTEAAIKFNVGKATIETWFKLGMLEGIQLGNELYIPANAKIKIKKQK